MTKKFEFNLELSAHDNVSAVITHINNKINKVAENTGLNAIKNRFNDVTKSVKKLGKVTSDIGKKLAIGAAASAGSLFLLSKSAADYGDNIAKLADRTGLSVKSLQEMQFAFGRSGFSAEEGSKSLEKFNKNLGDLKNDTGALNTFLKKFSPALSGQLKAASSTEDALNTIFTAYSNISDSATRAALGNAAFGRSGIKMTNLLSGGIVGLDELRSKFQELGGGISDKQARNSEAYLDSLEDLSVAFGGIKNRIGANFLPQLGSYVEIFTSRVVELDKSGAIQNISNKMINLLPTADQLISFINTGVSVMGSISGAAQPVIQTFTKLDGILDATFGSSTNAALATVGATIGATIIPAVSALITSLTNLSATFAITPIGLWSAGIAAVAAGAILVYRNWDNIASFFRSKLEPIIELFRRIKATYDNTIGNMFDSDKQASMTLSNSINQTTSLDSDLSSILKGLSQNSKSSIDVSFSNMPSNASVTTKSNNSNMNLDLGYALGGM